MSQGNGPIGSEILGKDFFNDTLKRFKFNKEKANRFICYQEIKRNSLWCQWENWAKRYCQETKD